MYVGDVDKVRMPGKDCTALPAIGERPQRLDEWNRVPAAAAYLNMSEKALWQWIGMRRIGVVRLGRSVRISREEIERIIREGTTPAVRAS